MRIAHYSLIAAVMLGVTGFLAAAFLDKRQIGMSIFLVGFFVAAASAVFIALNSANSDFSKLGLAIKISAGGFGVIVLSQLVDFLFGNDGLVGNIIFFVGVAVMMVGIAIAALRMAKF